MQTEHRFPTLRLPFIEPTSAAEIQLVGSTELGEISLEQLLSELHSEQNAEHFKEAVFYRLDFGDPILPALVIMQLPSEPDVLYVDTNRDMIFQVSERHVLSLPKSVEGENRSSPKNGLTAWTCDVSYNLHSSATTDHDQPRGERTCINSVPARFRSLPGKKLAVATAAQLTGMVRWQGELRQARLEDRNGNGRWFDLSDRLFVDLNGDGKIDPLLE